MDFSQVKEISIPEGDVTEIRDANGTVLWRKRDPDYGTITYRYSWISTRTYKIKTIADFINLGQETWTQVSNLPDPIVFSDGTSVPRSSITSFSFGEDFPTEIPPYFLAECDNLKCDALGAGLRIPYGVKSIGGNFLYSDDSFEGTVVIPETVTKIELNFMCYCSSYAKRLTVPSSVTSVGDGFMSNAGKFTGPLTINCTSSGSVPSDNRALSSFYYSDVPMYATGVTMTGPGAAAWRAALPDIPGTGSYYRHLIYNQ